jgi:hypothetical protein
MLYVCIRLEFDQEVTFSGNVFISELSYRGTTSAVRTVGTVDTEY